MIDSNHKTTNTQRVLKVFKIVYIKPIDMIYFRNKFSRILMYADIYDKIKADPEFQTLIKKRQKFSLVLTSMILLIYFSFILTIAYFPSLFAMPLSEGGITTLGIPVGVGIILFSFLLTGVYVKRANREFDAILHRLKDDVGIAHD